MRMVIGITGGIASGKSNVSSIIKDLGYPVIDSDAIYKELLLKPNSCYQAVLKSFGKEYLDENQEINRQKLGQLIFNNAEARDTLNSITHPLVAQEIEKRIKKSKKNFIFVDIPLLFEAHLEYLCDKIICVYVAFNTQLERLIERDGISEEYAKAKISSQMDLEQKKKLSDYFIDSKGSFKETEALTISLINKIKGDFENGKF